MGNEVWHTHTTDEVMWLLVEATGRAPQPGRAVVCRAAWLRPPPRPRAKDEQRPLRGRLAHHDHGLVVTPPHPARERLDLLEDEIDQRPGGKRLVDGDDAL